jgi:enamine deaminase RidA (YjgF/YER057c/UK114 family)
MVTENELKKSVIDVPGLPDPANAEFDRSYTQCVTIGDWVRVAGQVAIDENWETVSPEFEPQVRQVYDNIEKALDAAGSSMSNMVHQTAWLTDMRYADEFLSLRREIMGDEKSDLSTSSMIGTQGLARDDWLVEVEATALKEDSDIEKEVIDVPELADPTTHADIDRSYVQCVRAGDRVYVAGQVGVDENFNTVSHDFGDQSRQVFENIENALEAGGSSIGNMLDQTAWLTDMRNSDEFLDIRGKSMGDGKSDLSTSTLLGCSELALPELLVEVESHGLRDDADVKKEVIDVPGTPDPTSTEHEDQEASTRSYAQCIRVGDFVYLAGQIGVDENYDVVSHEFEPQVRQAFQHVETCLDHVGSGLENMYHMRGYLTDMEKTEEFLSIRRDIIGDDVTSSTVVGQELAWPELLVEVEARAYIPE